MPPDKNISAEFDVKKLTPLLAENPVVFEEKTREMILALIESAPSEARKELLEIQHRLDIGIFNAENWTETVEKNSVLFEKKRDILIDGFFRQIPEGNRKKLEHLQCRINLVRQSSKNPLDSLLKMLDMMWDSFYEEDGFLDQTKILGGIAEGFKRGLEKRQKGEKKTKTPKLALVKPRR